MNERIRELAEQAEMFANKGDRVDVKIMMEKFAELIVLECADVINDGVLNSDGSGDWYTGYVAGATECRRKINQHFGVEE